MGGSSGGDMRLEMSHGLVASVPVLEDMIPGLKLDGFEKLCDPAGKLMANWYFA